jgi:Protein of unknown function (DUF642)
MGEVSGLFRIVGSDTHIGPTLASAKTKGNTTNDKEPRMLRKSAVALLALAFGAVACSSSTPNNTGAGGSSAGGHAGTSAGGTSGGGTTGGAGTTGAGGSGVDNSCDAADAGGTSANLLSNGGFEQPMLGSAGAVQYFAVGDSTTLPGWSVFGSPGGNCANIRTPFTFGGFSATAAEGVQIMDLTGNNDQNGVSNAGVQQTVATVTGKTYVLSFSIGNWFDPANGLVGQTSKVAVLTNGTVVLHAVNSDMPSSQTLSWKRFCVRFVAAGPTTTIGLQCEDPVTDTADAIDDVSLVQQ